MFLRNLGVEEKPQASVANLQDADGLYKSYANSSAKLPNADFSSN